MAERPERARARFQRAKRNAKHMKDRHRHGLCLIAREKRNASGRWRTKSSTSASMGMRQRRRGTQRWRIGQTEASNNPCGKIFVSELTWTAYDKAEEDKGKHKKRYNRPCWPQKAKQMARREVRHVHFRRSLDRGRKKSSKEHARREHEKLQAFPLIS